MSDQSKKWLEKVCAGKSRRDAELLMRAVDTLEGNVYRENKYLWSPCRCISPGMTSFPGVWNWDAAFHAVGVSRWDMELARENISGFLQFQCEDGMLPDVLLERGEILAISSKPPVFAWAVEILHRRCPDMDFLKEVYPKLVKNEAFWSGKRCYEGLFYYDASNVGSKDYELFVKFESGWDNSVRWDQTIVDYWAIDLNCFMALFYRSLAYLAGELELTADVGRWSKREKELNERINEKLWDQEQEWYVDADRFSGKKSSVLTPASFMPLYLGIASRKQAEGMNKLAADPDKFYSGMPTVAYDDPEYSTEYWRGPTWLNVAYFAAKGLKNYGFVVADEIKETILNWCDRNKSGIYENYDSKTGEGLCCDHFSWSAVFVMEFILNYNAPSHR